MFLFFDKNLSCRFFFSLDVLDGLAMYMALKSRAIDEYFALTENLIKYDTSMKELQIELKDLHLSYDTLKSNYDQMSIDNNRMKDVIVNNSLELESLRKLKVPSGSKEKNDQQSLDDTGISTLPGRSLEIENMSGRSSLVSNRLEKSSSKMSTSTKKTYNRRIHYPVIEAKDNDGEARKPKVNIRFFGF